MNDNVVSSLQDEVAANWESRYGVSEVEPGERAPYKNVIPTRDTILKMVDPDREYDIDQIMEITGVGREGIRKALGEMAKTGLATFTGGGRGRGHNYTVRKWRTKPGPGTMQFQPHGYDTELLSRCLVRCLPIGEEPWPHSTDSPE